MNSPRQLDRQGPWSTAASCVVIASALLLASCSKPSDKPASQVAAKVNDEELTIHQVNFLLEQQRGLRPDQAEAARRVALERLVDQELALQKAREIKLDRSPRVMQKIEAARREIVARAYLEQVSEGASKPSDSALNKYYDENPMLFADRKIYQFQEWFVEAAPAQADAVRAKAQASKSPGDFSEYLRAANIRYESNQAIRGAEQLPLNNLASYAKMADGQTVVNTRPNGLHIITLVSARREPVDLTRAKPVIEQYLANEQKSRIVADDLKALRKAAKVTYLGSFAEGATGAASAPAIPASQTATGPK